MSHVTNVIVTASIMEDEYSLDSYLLEVFPDRLVRVSDVHSPIYAKDESGFGGSKNMETFVYMGAYNYLDVEGAVDILNAYDWIEPESALILMCEQEMNGFSVGHIGDEYTKYIGFEPTQRNSVEWPNAPDEPLEVPAYDPALQRKPSDNA